MKNLISKIALFSALAFSSEIRAQELDSYKNSNDFFKAGVGVQSWNKIKPYKNFSYFSLGFEKKLIKKLNLEGDFDYGSQSQKIESKEYNLAKLSISLGLNKYFLTSTKRKLSFYIAGGARYILMSETQTKGESVALGFYYGSGIESPINSETSVFLGMGVNQAKIKTNSGRLNISGPAMEFGIKIIPPIPIKNEDENEDPFDKTLEHYKKY